MSGTTDTQRGDPGEFPADEVRQGFEPSDWPVRKVALAVTGLVLVLFVSCALVAGFFFLVGGPQRPSAGELAARPIAPPPPRLQADDKAQRLALEAQAHRTLAGGPGRIGIDEAMRQTVAAGWRAGSPAAADPRLPPPGGSR